MTTEFNERARRLRNAVEPVAAGVYFAPEAHAAYEALGFDPSPAAAQKDGISRPELTSYFTSRGACLGQVPGEVVAAAFGCFTLKVVVPGVASGWQIADRETILRARGQGSTAMLQRVLGEEPEGLSRVTELPRRAADAAPLVGPRCTLGCARSASPGRRLGDMRRAADLVREHRGDSHVIVRAVGGADAVEVLLLTEQFWEVPPRAYTLSHGWTDADRDAGFDRLQERGLMTSGEKMTNAGRAFRGEVEVRTDELERPLLDALGEDLDELLAHLDAWSDNYRRRLVPPPPVRRLQHRRRTPRRTRADPRHRRRDLWDEGLTMHGLRPWGR